MSDINVHAATQEDTDAICELLQLLFTQEKEFKPDFALQQRAIADIINHPETGSILTLKRNGKTIATVSLLWLPSTALGGRVALLEDLIIAVDFRGQGLGKTLLNAAIDYARSLGCLRITLLTDHDNLTAQHLYQQAGFTASTMQTMRLML